MATSTAPLSRDAQHRALFFRGCKGDGYSLIQHLGRGAYGEVWAAREAKNAEVFEASLDFLGFVGTPDVVYEYSTSRVLVTEWVKGQHLSSLSADAGLRMTRMAVEACTASLVLTGYVHADPHEGNLMLGDDGRVVFLDFGLMSTVAPNIMEGFATGIQACLAEDYATLARVFVDVGFVIVDDYGAWEPCRKAVDDFRAQHGITDEIVEIDWTGVYWRKS